MDTHGREVTLSIFITHTSNSLSKNSNESQNQNLVCDTCGTEDATEKFRKVAGGICICSDCIDKILLLHVSCNHLKSLCPYCYGEDDQPKPCGCCDLTTLINKIQHIGTGE